MPKLIRTVDYYTCDFKCGHKADVKWKIENHEDICFCNPRNRSCRVCTNCEIKDGFMICNHFELQLDGKDKGTVYNYDMSVVWELKSYPVDEPYNYPKMCEVDNNNKSRPFPRRNCESFVLGKKRY